VAADGITIYRPSLVRLWFLTSCFGWVGCAVGWSIRGVAMGWFDWHALVATAFTWGLAMALLSLLRRQAQAIVFSGASVFGPGGPGFSVSSLDANASTPSTWFQRAIGSRTLRSRDGSSIWFWSAAFTPAQREAVWRALGVVHDHARHV
jgi:hypothetical protein